MRQDLALPFIIGLALRLVLPWLCHGFRFDDEHWQVIEPANGSIHGVWSITVEWREGLRCWLYPKLVSLPMRLAEAIGITNPVSINSFARMAHGLVSSFSVPLVYLATQQLSPQAVGKSALPMARAAAWFVALWPFAIYCGFHTHGEMAGAIFVLGAIAAAYCIKRESIAYLSAGALFGAALALKIDVAVAGLGFGLWQVLHARIKRALWLVAGVLPLVALVGLIDRLTWGTWFASVLGHARVNLVEGVGNQWGTSPWYTHVLFYFDILGAPALAAAMGLALVWRSLPDSLKATWFMNAFFVGVFATIPHKEKRFLAPLIYTGMVAAFATLAWIGRRVALSARPGRAIAAFIIFAAVVHGCTNISAYFVRQPWWDRIQAIQAAGQIPRIEKMFSPEWPAVFYLPRHLPAEAIKADPVTLEQKTRGLRRIGIASDGSTLDGFEKLGFRCSPWPARPPGALRSSVPQAYECEREK